jgi:hypothetical protein
LAQAVTVSSPFTGTSFDAARARNLSSLPSLTSRILSVLQCGKSPEKMDWFSLHGGSAVRGSAIDQVRVSRASREALHSPTGNVREEERQVNLLPVLEQQFLESE